MSFIQKDVEREEKFQKEEARKMWKMARFRPPMDFMKAKLTLGINPAMELSSLEMEEIHKRFVIKNTMVSTVTDMRKLSSSPAVLAEIFLRN